MVVAVVAGEPGETEIGVTVEGGGVGVGDEDGPELPG